MDRMVLLGGGLVLALAVVWTWRRQADIADVGRGTENAARSEPEFAVWTHEVFAVDAGSDWLAPGPRGEEAIGGFDLFTPPTVYFDRQHHTWTMAAPEASGAETSPSADPELPAGIELIAVEARPYRLQLVGYAGSEGGYWGVFENLENQEGGIARAGHRFADLGVEVRTLEVRLEQQDVPDSMPLPERVATAQVWDERERRSVVLTSRERRVDGVSVAVVRMTATGEVRRIGVGESLVYMNREYTVETVTPGPATVTLWMAEPGRERRRWTLSLSEPAAAVPPRALP